ncbi:MAG: hypothetical protein Q9204_003609 [Flavoplaca sp. TL-2023a]
MVMPYTVSLNGADNVGKTTQIDLFPSNIVIGKVGGLHQTPETKIGVLHRRGRLQEWWWESSNEDFVCSIVQALTRRYCDSVITAHSDVPEVVIFDRGAAMFEAVLTAVIATKSPDHDLDSARAVLQVILDEHCLRLPKERLAILLTHGKNLEQSIDISLDREEDCVDERYRRYQLLLQTEMQRQERSGVYQHVIKINLRASIRDVQNELREVLLQYTGNCMFIPMLHRLDCLYIFSGLSESGKSSVAEGLCSHYGASLAFRAKIVYFNNLISEKLGKPVYCIPEKEQALNLLHELERFSNNHYWLKIMTIESMHRHLVAKWLKTWLGDKVQVIYIDTDDVKRFERALIAPEEVVRNDDLKRERGVEMIRLKADLVLDNDGSFGDTLQNLIRFVESKVRRE